MTNEERRCYQCKRPTDDRLELVLHMCSHWCCDEHDRMREDLLATRRALKMAQAAWWRSQEVAYSRKGPTFEESTRSFWDRAERLKMLRAVRLCRYFTDKFEREAKEMGK